MDEDASTEGVTKKSRIAKGKGKQRSGGDADAWPDYFKDVRAQTFMHKPGIDIFPMD